MKNLLLLFLVLPLWARLPLDSAGFCSGQQACLKDAPSWCSNSLRKANEEIRYDIDFCDDLFKLKDWKIPPDSNSASQYIYGLLGKKYRMEYPLEGLLPVNFEMIDYLMNHLSFTAMLINAYEKTHYSAHYINSRHTRFSGSNGGSLSGKFEFLKNSKEKGQYLIVGEGYANVLKWKLKGDAVLLMDFDPLGKRDVAFEVKCIAFPGNSLINEIMELDFFEKKVMEFIQEIVDDITQAAYRFADGDLKPIQNYKDLQSKEAQKQLQEFKELIQKSGYKD